ncbi:unnamed protein product [Arctia plantaginis]|uniref:Uncharacterized protein n=1 Tax=Arctia plantaginis TaxID=874455 RepID=A0A8S1BX32_ARCPL|nr:unnamed protein product [Arctia plantaginis]
MEAIQNIITKHDCNFTVLSGMDNAVKNLFNRLRICVRVVCCIPIDHIIPSEIFQKKADVYRFRQELPQTRARELRFEMLPKSRTSLKNKNINENSIQTLISKTQISKSQSSLKDKRSKDFENKTKSLKRRSILKDRKTFESSEIKPKIDNPILEIPVKKQQLSFQTSENKLQSKKAKCRLFNCRSKKKLKKPGNEASGLNKSLRWRIKSSTSGKSSENGSKCDKQDSRKKSKKSKTKKKDCIRLKFVCSNSNSLALQCSDKKCVGDGPATEFNCLNPLIDYTDDFIMDYFNCDNKKTLP